METHKRFLTVINTVDNPNPIWKSENILRFYLPQFVVLLLIMVTLTRCIHYLLRPFNQPHFVAECIVSAHIYVVVYFVVQFVIQVSFLFYKLLNTIVLIFLTDVFTTTLNY